VAGTMLYEELLEMFQTLSVVVGVVVVDVYLGVTIEKGCGEAECGRAGWCQSVSPFVRERLFLCFSMYWIVCTIARVFVKKVEG